MVVLAAGLVILPGAPLGLITTGVQALAGILLPSATVFLLLLCNDRDVLGPWVNRPWLNIVASIIVGILVVLSLILAVETVFPSVDATQLLVVLSGALVLGLAASGVAQWRSHRAAAKSENPAVNRALWRMPPLDTLPKPARSLTRTIGLTCLRGYLVVAAVVLLLKVIGLGLGH